MSKTLKLTVNKTWFDMFKSGVKTEELREIKPYWITRLCYDAFMLEKGLMNNIQINGRFYQPKKYDFIELTNGYSKTSPQITFEFKGTRIGNDYNMSTGGVLMTDEEGYKRDCFIISVGREVGRQNC